MSQPFTGLLAYPITPLTSDGGPDLAALGRLVRGAAGAGVSGVTVLATSGAGVTFDRAERCAVAKAAVDAQRMGAADGQPAIPVYTAVSAASTREVVNLAKDAEQAGIDGLLLAPFSYLPLSGSEVCSLFESVTNATSLPLCFYNKPLQTHYDVSPEMLSTLARTANLVAVKETMRRDDVHERLERLRDAVGPDFAMGLSADGPLLSKLPSVDSWHTGLAALLPADYVDVWQSARSGRPQGNSLARLRGVAAALGGTDRPIGALHTLATILGVWTAEPRGPFGPATADDVAAIKRALAMDVDPARQPA